MKEFNHTAHRDLWLWLAEKPVLSKQAWPGWEDRGGPYSYVLHNCFACETAGHNCSNCPLIWPVNKEDARAETCFHHNSLYHQWTSIRHDLTDMNLQPTEREQLMEQLSTIAKRIANLPIKPCCSLMG